MDGGSVRTPHWGCHSYAASAARLCCACAAIFVQVRMIRLTGPSLLLPTNFSGRAQTECSAMRQEASANVSSALLLPPHLKRQAVCRKL